MTCPSTTRLWRNRLDWPLAVATAWFVFYTSSVLYSASFGGSVGSVPAALVSARHLTHPLGWAYALSFAVVLVGGGLRAYMFIAGH